MKPQLNPPDKPKGKRGGARPGSGRPPGATTIRRYESVQAAIDAPEMDGVTPILVMLDNMKFYYDRAASFTKKLEEIAETVSAEDLKSPGNEKIIETLKLIAKVGDFRMKSQQCAMETAPYVHPRLSAMAIRVTPGDSKKPVEITEHMSARVAAEEYARLLAEDG